MDSGLLKEKDSTQNVNELRRILDAVDNQGKDVDCLVSVDGENVWRYWIQPALDKLKSTKESDRKGRKKGDTIQAYFCALQ